MLPRVYVTYAISADVIYRELLVYCRFVIPKRNYREDKRPGRVPKYDYPAIQKIKNMWDRGFSFNEISLITGISSGYLKQICYGYRRKENKKKGGDPLPLNPHISIQRLALKKKLELEKKNREREKKKEKEIQARLEKEKAKLKAKVSRKFRKDLAKKEKKIIKSVNKKIKPVEIPEHREIKKRPVKPKKKRKVRSCII